MLSCADSEPLDDFATLCASSVWAKSGGDADFDKAKRFACAALDALAAEPARYESEAPDLEAWLIRQVRRSVPLGFGLTPLWWWLFGQVVRLIVAEIVRRLMARSDAVSRRASDVLIAASASDRPPSAAAMVIVEDQTPPADPSPARSLPRV